jgi:tRNA(Arg) A34 adenosine deaminase TadA
VTVPARAVDPRRRLFGAAAGVLAAGLASRVAAADGGGPSPPGSGGSAGEVPAAIEAQRAWFAEAERMRRLAVDRGDQPYGAVLVLAGRIVGEGPSRVVERGDPSAPAAREAIRDARRRLGRDALDGAVLVSTSRPCAACEAVAAAAGVARMLHGPTLQDAGAPRR